MLESIQEWSSSMIESQLNAPFFFVAVFFLGLFAAVGSCCNVGVIAAVTSYAGTNTQNEGKSTHVKTGFSFFLGNVISLSLLGALTGFVSQSVGSTVGEYWTLIAGFVVVYLGLKSLDMLPFDLKLGDKLASKTSTLANKGFIFGLALGGFATACSASCNPVFSIILGASFLQGNIFFSWLTLFVFAIGYSLPLGGVLVGAGFGFDQFSNKLLNKKKIVNEIFGFVLVLVGFCLLLGWL